MTEESEDKPLTDHEQDLWQLFIEVAQPEREFADTSEDNKQAIIKAMNAAYTKGWNDSMR